MADGSSPAARPSLVVRVFTHPACSGCGAAVHTAWALGRRHPHVKLRTVSLDNKAGLDEAHAEHIKTIPTVIVSDGGAEVARFVGAPTESALEAALRGGAAPAAAEGER